MPTGQLTYEKEEIRFHSPTSECPLPLSHFLLCERKYGSRVEWGCVHGNKMQCLSSLMQKGPEYLFEEDVSSKRQETPINILHLHKIWKRFSPKAAKWGFSWVVGK